MPNWLQLGRFVLVGASGFALNLVIYGALLHATEMPYVLAAVISNSVAIANNFVLHRIWTFQATGDRKRHQASRFLLVCGLGFAINIAVLTVLVEAVGISKLLAEAVAAATAAPVTFVANRQWTFRPRGKLLEWRRATPAMSEPAHMRSRNAPGDAA